MVGGDWEERHLPRPPPPPSIRALSLSVSLSLSLSSRSFSILPRHCSSNPWKMVQTWKKVFLRKRSKGRGGNTWAGVSQRGHLKEVWPDLNFQGEIRNLYFCLAYIFLYFFFFLLRRTVLSRAKREKEKEEEEGSLSQKAVAFIFLPDSFFFRFLPPSVVPPF